MENEIIQPWYKQFWPWFLISIPATSVVLSLIMVTKALNQPHVMVSDSYNKSGLEVNQDLTLDKMAQKAGISAIVHSDESGKSFSINLNSSLNEAPDILIIKLEHPTLKEKDVILQLPNTGPVYSQTINETITGTRYITITTPENDWRLRGEITFPNVNGSAINPAVY